MEINKSPKSPSVSSDDDDGSLIIVNPKNLVRRLKKYKIFLILFALFGLVFIIVALIPKSQQEAPQQEAPQQEVPQQQNPSPPQPPPPEKHEIQNNYSLNELCTSTKWRKNLYLNCTTFEFNKHRVKVAQPLGANNLRSMLMACIRFAIDAGITGIITPRAPIRLESDSGQFNLWTDLTYLINYDHSKQVLNKECPQLVFHDQSLNISNRLPNIFRTTFQWPPKPLKIGEYQSIIDQILLAFDIDPQNPIPTVIYENEAMFGWKFIGEPQVHLAMLNVFPFRHDLLSFGARISEMIESKYSRYVGFHLRVERGWVHDGYEETLNLFKESFYKNSPNVTTVYVAVGDVAIENRFRQDMNKLNITVVSKWSLAYGNQWILDELSLLKFDQRAVVDQEILTRSTFFYGNGFSSLAYIIGYDRGNGNLTNCKCDLFYGADGTFQCCF